MQTASFRIYARIIKSISYEDKCYYTIVHSKPRYAIKYQLFSLYQG